MSTVPAMTPIRTVDETVEARPRSMLVIDPLLALAALGLVACSLITLKGATRHAVPGHPLYYVERQGIYAAVGLLVAILLPVISKARHQAMRTKCMSNLRQLATAVIMYATDNRQTMPFVNVSLSPRFESCRGMNPSRARIEDNLGKSAKLVLAARTRMAIVAI